MTIVAVAAAPDGIVVAADGRTTLLSGRRHRVASDHTRKVFAPLRGRALATYGAALIGERTIAGLVEDLFAQNQFVDGQRVDQLAAAVDQFFTAALEHEGRETGVHAPLGSLGFLVVGYDAAGMGRVDEVLLPAPAGRGPTTEGRLTTASPGVVFRGRTQYIRRLLEGIDADALSDPARKQLSQSLEGGLEGLGFILNETLSLQDALDLAMFVVRLTIDMERVTDGTVARPEGVPACGGDVQAVMVTRDESRWLVEPSLRPREAGQSEFG